MADDTDHDSLDAKVLFIIDHDWLHGRIGRMQFDALVTAQSRAVVELAREIADAIKAQTAESS